MREEFGSAPDGGFDPAPPYDVHHAGAASPLLLVGDHAGRAIPPALANLGLPDAALTAHIAWDIGVAGLGRALAAALDATFVAQRFSRLMIDCNRDPARPDSIVEVSDGLAIPGNVGLSAEARLERRQRIFDPYHARIGAELDRRAGRATTLVALHSFTPALAGDTPRPWRLGVLHLGASPASARLLAGLRSALGHDAVGDNQPYQMGDTDYTAPHHAVRRGLDYIELEVRQDLLGDTEAERDMAALLAPHITAAV